MTPETILTGGRTTTGVVRIGATVRRPRQPNSAFVGALLKHLEHVGFDGASRFLGVDESGRDILSFIEGDVPAELGWHDDEILVAAARLIRRYHDATQGFPDLVAERAAGCEVVCHNDVSPCNAVFRDNRPIALIDFDGAAPGTRLHDLGYAAWLWLDLGDGDIDAAMQSRMQSRRLRLFAQAYGFTRDIGQVINAVLARQQILIDEGNAQGKTEMACWAAECRKWTLKNLSSAE